MQKNVGQQRKNLGLGASSFVFAHVCCPISVTQAPHPPSLVRPPPLTLRLPSDARSLSRVRHTNAQPHPYFFIHTADPKAPAFGLPVDLVAGKKDADKGKGKGKGDGKKTGKGKPPATVAAAAKKGKVAGMKALEVAQQSTASLGRCVCVFV